MLCLQELILVTQEEQPDLVLVSGDIFHQAEVWQGRSHREVMQAREVIMKLSRAAGQVIVMRGTPNHDSAEAFEELKAHFELVDNVHVITTPEVINTPFANVSVLPGFDRGAFRAAHPGISKEDENVVFTEELGKIVTGLRSICDEDKVSILMSHYTVPGCNTESGQTQFLTQFEPIITQDMLMAANYDLVTLGHIHRPQTLPITNQRIYYSGAINALNFNDEGQQRGFWIHEITDNSEWNHRFVETPYRKFYTLRFGNDDISQINSGNYDQVIESYRSDIKSSIVRILYQCTADNNKAINKVLLTKQLMVDGAFWVSGIEAESIDSANRTELSKQEDPEDNLIQYLLEKMIDADKVDRILEKARPIIAKAKANSEISEFFGTFVPKEIEVKNYRNYAEQYFSFENINFCTINGSNGSGKSSLFMDAIIDCLYEEPREGTNTGWIRNDEKARSGSISFVFALGDKTFRVVRTRTKSGKPTLNLAELQDGTWVDRSKEKVADTQKEIIRILGMDSMTFKACVLIMQDQYGIFLEAGKEERVGVLSNLLGLGIYGVMEDLTKDQLGTLKRDIAAKKQTINIHTDTITSYGNPTEEKEKIDQQLAAEEKVRDILIKEKEDKSLMLKLQQEAADRKRKIQDTVTSLENKAVASLDNLSTHSNTIFECEGELLSEVDDQKKADRYNELAELDKELSKAAVEYDGKSAELLRIRDWIKKNESDIDRSKTSIQGYHQEIESLQSTDESISEIKNKVKEWLDMKDQLEEAYQQERNRSSLQQELSNVMSDRAAIISMYNSKLNSMEERLSSLNKQTAILETVDCVDIGQAKCGFLAAAKEAKESLSVYPEMIEKLKADHEINIKPYDIAIVEINKKLEDSKNLSADIERIRKKILELDPYEKKLTQLQRSEVRIASIKELIDREQSNIAQAQKIVREGQLEATEIEKQMEILGQKKEQCITVRNEMLPLIGIVQKVNLYPVIHERLENAKKQKADESTRLFEIQNELTAAKEELSKTEGSTVDISGLDKSLQLLVKDIATVNSCISEYQQAIGSLTQKINEVEKLDGVIQQLRHDCKKLSADISDYDLLKAAFSQDGIPHQIIRSLVPLLSEISSNILGQMTGGKMGITFATEKVMKSNSNKEVVTLDIFIEEYGKSTLPYLSKSGGEKVKASLSVILALAEIKSSTAGIQLGMLFIDEPPFLDGDGIQAYCNALETIQQRYPELKIMAITHDNSMKARFPQSIDVIKTDEGSKILI
jgi:exonuclease SbcC